MTKPPSIQTPEQIAEQAKAARIATLNDQCRQAWVYPNCRIVMTDGIRALDPDMQSRIAEAVQRFDDFKADNDPYGEHDFGSIEIDAHTKVLWKFDYFDLASFATDTPYGAEHCDDARTTLRILTIMLADEY